MLQEITRDQKLKVAVLSKSHNSSVDAGNLIWWRTWTSSWWASVYF